jgi:hypothetical protein
MIYYDEIWLLIAIILFWKDVKHAIWILQNIFYGVVKWKIPSRLLQSHMLPALWYGAITCSLHCFGNSSLFQLETLKEAVVFLFVVLYSLERAHHLGGTCHLHLWDWRVSKKPAKAGTKLNLPLSSCFAYNVGLSPDYIILQPRRLYSS